MIADAAAEPYTECDEIGDGIFDRLEAVELPLTFDDAIAIVRRRMPDDETPVVIDNTAWRLWQRTQAIRRRT